MEFDAVFWTRNWIFVWDLEKYRTYCILPNFLPIELSMLELSLAVCVLSVLRWFFVFFWTIFGFFLTLLNCFNSASFRIEVISFNFVWSDDSETLEVGVGSDLEYQLTLSGPRGADNARHITIGPPSFWTMQRLCDLLSFFLLLYLVGFGHFRTQCLRWIKDSVQTLSLKYLRSCNLNAGGFGV